MKKAITNLVCLLSLLAAGPAQASIIIRITPSTQSVDVGTPVNVAVTISGLGDLTAPSLSTFDLNINFDPTLLTFSHATFGDPVLGDQLDLLGLGSLTSDTPGVGTVNLFELSFDSPSDLDTLQAGSFTLATLTFNAPSCGTSNLEISINALGDSLGDPLAATIQSGSITCIPEPPSLLLVSIGILSMVGVMTSAKRNL